MSIIEKEFVLKQVFKDVSRMEDEDEQDSNIEEHFRIPWYITIGRYEDHLGLFLHCEKANNEKEWSIEVWAELKVRRVYGKRISKIGKAIFRSTDESSDRGWHEFMKWEDMMRNYVIDDTLQAEIHVKIKKMTGIYEKKILRNFDESNKPFSDVALVVEDQKFFVSKLFLANQSSYFNSLLFGNFKESKQEEVTLNDIEARDFQNFLEVLYGEPAVDEDTVTGIIYLADMYDTTTVRRQCEEFLMEKSRMPMKYKLGVAVKYNLHNLKNKCLLEIETFDDVTSVLQDDLTQMDRYLLVSLVQKLMSSTLQELFLLCKNCFPYFFE